MMPNPLTIRERNILVLLREGNSQKEIASMLKVSTPAIQLGCRFIYAKLGAQNATHAVVLAIRKRWIKLDEEG